MLVVETLKLLKQVFINFLIDLTKCKETGGYLLLNDLCGIAQLPQYNHLQRKHFGLSV